MVFSDGEFWGCESLQDIELTIWSSPEVNVVNIFIEFSLEIAILHTMPIKKRWD